MLLLYLGYTALPTGCTKELFLKMTPVGILNYITSMFEVLQSFWIHIWKLVYNSYLIFIINTYENDIW